MPKYRFSMKADEKTGLILPEDVRRGVIVADSKDEAEAILLEREERKVLYQLGAQEGDPRRAHQVLDSQRKPYKLKKLEEVD